MEGVPNFGSITAQDTSRQNGFPPDEGLLSARTVLKTLDEVDKAAVELPTLSPTVTKDFKVLSDPDVEWPSIEESDRHDENSQDVWPARNVEDLS
jgi:hypothetical protein